MLNVTKKKNYLQYFEYFIKIIVTILISYNLWAHYKSDCAMTKSVMYCPKIENLTGYGIGKNLHSKIVPSRGLRKVLSWSYGLAHIFSGIKLFCLTVVWFWFPWNLTQFQLIHTAHIKNENKSCLNELKLFKVRGFTKC